MTEEPSLLQKIREKEMEMSVKIDLARRESDAIIERTKREATVLIEGYEKESERVVSEYHQKERDAVEQELEQLKIRGKVDEQSTIERGEKNLPHAVDLIVKKVIPE